MGSRRRCCCKGTRICLAVCTSPAVPIYGATIELYTGSTLVASCTTDSSGCCSFTQAGSYTVKYVINGTTTSAGTRTLAGSTITIAVSAGAAQVVCCGGYAVPQSPMMTDATGTYTMTYISSGFYPTWIACVLVTVLSCTVTTPGGVCVAAAPAMNQVVVCYQLQCVSTNSPVFTLTRSWGWVYEQGTLTPIYFAYASGACAAAGMPSFCSPAPPAACGSPHTDTASFGANPTSSAPFALSGTPAAAGGNYTADPIGGSVAFSA